MYDVPSQKAKVVLTKSVEIAEQNVDLKGTWTQKARGPVGAAALRPPRSRRGAADPPQHCLFYCCTVATQDNAFLLEATTKPTKEAKIVLKCVARRARTPPRTRCLTPFPLMYRPGQPPRIPRARAPVLGARRYHTGSQVATAVGTYAVDSKLSIEPTIDSKALPRSSLLALPLHCCSHIAARPWGLSARAVS